MNSNQLIDAIGAVNDAAVLDAKAFHYRGDAAAARPQFRKMTVGVAAVLAVLLCIVAVAFAVDQEFRAAVLSFFHISAEDHVERVPVEDQPLTGDDAAGKNITVTRVRVPNNGHAANGLFAICSDEIEYKQGSHYDLYKQEGGELVKLELQSTRRDFSYNGTAYGVYLEWAEDNEGRCALGYVELSDSVTGQYAVLQFVPGTGEKLLLLLDGKYPVIIDLYEDGVQELIPAAVMDELPFLKAVHITRDGKYLLLNAGRYYCAAIGTEPLTCLDELCGAALTGCSYIGEGIFSCHSLTGGAVDEADLAAYVRGETPASPIDFGMITTWNVDVQRQAAGVVGSTAATAFTNPDALWHGTERTEPFSPGLVYVPHDEGAYMLEVDGERHIYVVDLRSGERNMIEGALWPDVDWPYAELVGSPEGDKLALIQRDATNGSLCHLSVIDFKKMRLFAIERDTKEVGNEHYADWFDNDTIMVDNNVTDETGHNTGDSWYYLYRIY